MENVENVVPEVDEFEVELVEESAELLSLDNIS